MRGKVQLGVIVGMLMCGVGSTFAQSTTFNTFQSAEFRYRIIDAGTPNERAVCEVVGCRTTLSDIDHDIGSAPHASVIPAPGSVMIGACAVSMLSVRRRRR